MARLMSISNGPTANITDAQLAHMLGGNVPKRDIIADIERSKAHIGDNPNAFMRDLNTLMPLLDALGY